VPAAVHADAFPGDKLRLHQKKNGLRDFRRAAPFFEGRGLNHGFNLAGRASLGQGGLGIY